MVTILIYIPTIFNAIAAPTAGMDSSAYPKCYASTILPTAEEVALNSQSYWMLIIWEWPGQFALKPITGFFFGILDVLPFALSGILNEGFILPFW